MFSVSDYILMNDKMWQKTMNDLLKCPAKDEATIIFELQKLNAERNILEKAKAYERQHG